MSNYSTLIQSLAPTHWWEFPTNGTITAVSDLGSNPVNLTATGSITASNTGLPPTFTGASLDGSTKYFTTASNTTVGIPFTVSIWFKTSSAQGVIAEFNNGAGSGVWGAYIGTDGKVYSWIYNGAVVVYSVSLHTVTDGVVHHLMFENSNIQNPFTISSYIDGIYMGSGQTSLTLGTQSFAWSFGHGSVNGLLNAPASKFLNGIISSIAVWESTSLRRQTAYDVASQGYPDSKVALGSTTAFNHFMTTPLVYSQNPSIFGKFFKDAQSGIKRIGTIGTSIQTSPGGAGVPTFQNLQIQMALAMGNFPETDLVSNPSPPVSYINADYSAAVTGSNQTPFLAYPSSTNLPPNLTIAGIKHGDSGCEFLYDPSLAANASGLSDIRLELGTDILPKGNVKMRVYFASYIGSSTTFNIQNIPYNIGDSLFFSTASSSTNYTFSSLNSSPAIYTMDFPIDQTFKQAVSMVITNNDVSNQLMILGVKFFNVDNQFGVQLQSISVGGQPSSYFLTQAGTSQQVLTSLGFDAYLLMCQGNDPGNVTLDQSATDLNSIMTFIRAAHITYGRPAPIFFIASDSPRSEDPTPAIPGAFQSRAYNSGIGYYLAQTNADVCAINLMKSLFLQNWTPVTANDSNIPIQCTANILVGATSATLTANWTSPTGTYSLKFSNGEERNVSLTNASTAISWYGGLTKQTINFAITSHVVFIGPIQTLNAVPSAGGSGYSLNDVLAITGGGGTGAYAQVTAISGGSVTGLSIIVPGSGYIPGTGFATTGGTGTGCTVGIINIFNLTLDGTHPISQGARLFGRTLAGMLMSSGNTLSGGGSYVF